MFSIHKEVFEGIIAHARRDLPNEACGYLAGTEGIVTKNYELTNIDHSPEHFSFEPAEQFKTLKDSRNEGMRILGNYHSHPVTPARPSMEDIRLAYDPSIFYVIISLALDEVVVNAYRIQNGVVEKEEIHVV